MFARLLTLLWSKEPPQTLAHDAPSAWPSWRRRSSRRRPPPRQRAEKKKEEEKKKTDEGQMKKAKEKAGKMGRHDAKPKETVIPKGEKDMLREKVAKVGLLGLIGKQKREGSGHVEAVRREQRRRAGDRRHGGRQDGRPGTARAACPPAARASGGGGTGYGHIYGAGNLDTGGRGAQGHGRGPKLAERGEHEVKRRPGPAATATTDGSLTQGADRQGRARAPVGREVLLREGAAAQGDAGRHDRRSSGVIQPDGTVGKANVKTTSMGDAAVEGCILRQVKQWVFPKAPGRDPRRAIPSSSRGVRDADRRARCWSHVLAACRRAADRGCQALNEPIYIAAPRRWRWHADGGRRSDASQATLRAAVSPADRRRAAQRWTPTPPSWGSRCPGCGATGSTWSCCYTVTQHWTPTRPARSRSGVDGASE